MEFTSGPGRKGVEVAADVGDEAFRELAARVELGEVANDGAPEEAINASSSGGGGRVTRRVKVEGALEGSNGGAGEALPFLRLGRMVRMGGGGGG